MPFIAGVAVVTIWLHVRYGALCGLLFLFLATASPLLLDLSRQARGYGIAFLAMSVVVVAALELLRSDRTWAIVALCVGGVVGAWTLPHFTVAFLAIGAVLLAAGVTPLEARGRTWRFDRRDRSVVRPARRRHPRQLAAGVRRRALVPLDRHGSDSIRPWCPRSRS